MKYRAGLMMVWPCLLSFLLLPHLVLFGQDDMNSGIIYGANHAFSLTAPSGWVLDNSSGVKQGLHAVFYRQGETWEKALTVMYVNTASLEDEAHTTLEQLIDYDIGHFKSNYPDMVVTDGKDMAIKDGVLAKIFYMSGKSYGNFEALAYIDAGKTGVMIILSSRTKKGFDDALRAFEKLVQSYFFISDQVINEKGKAEGVEHGIL